MINATGAPLKSVPVIIFCGGRKVLLQDTSCVAKNKALIKVNGKPLFWWVMLQYVLYGACNFVLNVGVQAEWLSDELLLLGAKKSSSDQNYYAINIFGQDCHIRLVNSGENAKTGQRLLACKPYLKDKKIFAVTYSDTLSDVNLDAVHNFHQKHGLVATLVGAHFPIRFRILGIRLNEIKVRAFASRPVIESASINGGFYFFTDAIWGDEFNLTEHCALENEPLEILASSKQLAAFDHLGKWQNFDAERDLDKITVLAKDLEVKISGKN